MAEPNVNNIHAFVEQLTLEGNTVVFNTVNNELTCGGQVLSLDWLADQTLMPRELSEGQLRRFQAHAMSMTVGDGFTWNDYAKGLWQGLRRTVGEG